jgi:hypothetical protein
LVLAGALVRALAADVALSWEPSPDTVAFYRVYHTVGVTNSQWELVATVPSTVLSLVQTNLGVGVHRWHATALTVEGIESDSSNEVIYTIVKPRPPVLGPVQLFISKVESDRLPSRVTLEQACGPTGLLETGVHLASLRGRR